MHRVFLFHERGVKGSSRCSVAAMASFCFLSACKDAPLGQRQGGVFRLPPPYLWTPPTPQRAKGCSPLTILKKKSKHKKASAAPVGAIALTLFSLLHLKPLSRCATAPPGGAFPPAKFTALPETFPPCQGLSLWESWQARQGLTERASPFPAAPRFRRKRRCKCRFPLRPHLWKWGSEKPAGFSEPQN